jgi:hypothetical protein
MLEVVERSGDLSAELAYFPPAPKPQAHPLGPIALPQLLAAINRFSPSGACGS